MEGAGFMEVLGSGGVRYIRGGHFAVSEDGVLVNSLGHPVLSPAGGEGRAAAGQRVIQLPAGKIEVGQRGRISVRSVPLAQLSVVEFRDVSALRKQGHSLFINPDDDNLIREGVKATVRQGYVEQSNVNAVEEMSELIKAHRHFESIQQVIKNYDHVTKQAVNHLLKF